MAYKRRASWRYRRSGKRRRTNYGYRRRSFRTYRRKRNYRRRRIPYIIQPYAKTKFKCAYQQEYTIAIGANHVSDYFYVNDIFNPFRTTTSQGTTTGLAAYKALYNKCLVYGAKIRCMVTNHNSYIAFFDQLVYDEDQGSPSTWFYDYQEHPGIKRILIPSCPASTGSVPGYAVAKASRYYNIRKIKGSKLDENDYTEWNQSDHPIHKYIYKFWIGHTDGAGKLDPISFRVFWTITFYTKWMQKSNTLFDV